MSPDKNGWIKIKTAESLPEEDTKCFVWYEENNLGKNDWCFSHYHHGEFCVDGVTHWRPEFQPPVKIKRK